MCCCSNLPTVSSIAHFEHEADLRVEFHGFRECHRNEGEVGCELNGHRCLRVRFGHGCTRSLAFTVSLLYRV